MAAANCACGAPLPWKVGGSHFRTPHSIFSIFVQFLVTNFLFLELLPNGPVSRFLSVRDHILARLITLVRSVSLQGCSSWRSNFSASLFLVTNVTIFSKNVIFDSSKLVAPGEHSERMLDHFPACSTQLWDLFALHLHQRPPADPPKKPF